MKECFKCHIIKPLTEFYRHPAMADGHLGKCKSCNKKDTILNYEKNREYYLAYDRAREKTPERRANKNRASARERAKNPKRIKARKAVWDALQEGTMVKEPCHCGEIKVEAHHPDYDKPLFVIWLCHKHHKHIHGRKAL